MYESIALFEPYREGLVSMLKRSDSKADAESAIQDWSEAIAKDENISDVWYRANLLASMAGRLFVHTIELGSKRVSLAAPAPETFVNLPFDDAIREFLRRTPATPEEFAAMSDLERFRSFTVSRIASERVRDNMQEMLAKAFQPDGIGLREFIRTFEDDAAKIGISPNSHGYLENVFRTNTSVSYNAGRYTAQKDPDVIAATGFWQYLTVDDDRVRDEHAELHGKTWSIGDPEAERAYPPNGFQCRCSMVVVDVEDVDQADIDRDVDVDVAEGFEGPPTGIIENEANA